jgi:hypothetical protein
VSLAEARIKADALRKQHRDQADPLAHRRAAEARRRSVPTFAERTAEYIEWRKSLPPTREEPEAACRIVPESGKRHCGFTSYQPSDYADRPNRRR